MIGAYYQLTKPGIIYGNLMVTAGGFLLASQARFEVRLLIGALLGTGLIIASACVFNNYIDRGIDARMTRTQNRALVTGKIPVKNAMWFAAVLGLLGCAALITLTNWLTLAVGLTGFVVYVVLYGIAKRRSVHGTLVGSISGAVPPVAGYTAVTNRFDGGAILLFAILVCWQMPHFYAIALYRLKDYKRARLPVLSVVRGVEATKLQISLYITAFVVMNLLLSFAGFTGFVYAGVMGGLGLGWLILGLRTWRMKNASLWGRQMFLFSLIIILSLPIMWAVGSVLP